LNGFDLFLSKTGDRFQKVRLCRCGSVLPDESSYCGKCGVQWSPGAMAMVFCTRNVNPGLINP
jgi:hypothetical protein